MEERTHTHGIQNLQDPNFQAAASLSLLVWAWYAYAAQAALAAGGLVLASDPAVPKGLGDVISTASDASLEALTSQIIELSAANQVEYAIVRTASGDLVVIEGGAQGFIIPFDVSVAEIVTHTHVFDGVSPSVDDLITLQQIGQQASSVIYVNNGQIIINNFSILPK